MKISELKVILDEAFKSYGDIEVEVCRPKRDRQVVCEIRGIQVFKEPLDDTQYTDSLGRYNPRMHEKARKTQKNFVIIS